MSVSWPTGLVTALVTPLRDDVIDREALRSLVDYQIDNGATGLVVSGGTGEYGALSFDERTGLIRDVAECAAGRVPVIAATGCLTTRDAIRLSQAAEHSGAFGLLVASPYGEPINWHERVAYYTALAQSVTTPIMIYNTPPAGLLTLDQIIELSALPHVSAVKDSSGDPALMGDLLAWRANSDFAVYVGMDSFLLEAIIGGANGAVFGTANFLPTELAMFITQLIANGPSVEVMQQWRTLRPMLRMMESATNYVGMCKVGLKLRGIDVGSVRAPYLMPGNDEIGKLRAALGAVIGADAVVGH